MRGDETAKARLGRGVFFENCEMADMAQFWIFDFGFSIIGTILPSREFRFAILESKIGNPKSKIYRINIASP